MESETTETQAGGQETTESQTGPNGDAGDTGDTGEPEGLGDAGKQAIDRMKTKWTTERDKRKALEAELEKLRAPKSDGDEPDIEAIRREAATQAVAAANERILKAEVRAAAAGKLADPADALRLMDMSQFEVDSEGNVDAQEITEAIDSLLESKPYLSAQSVRRFQGSADGGARKGNRAGAQLTHDDLKGMTPEAIVKAKAEGRLADLGYK